MHFHIELVEPEHYLRAVIDGEATLEDLIAVMDAMTEEGSFQSSRRLWDLRNCDLKVSSAKLRDIAEIGKSRDSGKGKGALLVSRDLGYGLSRIHKVFRESEDHSVEVFRDEKEALCWLLE